MRFVDLTDICFYGQIMKAKLEAVEQEKVLLCDWIFSDLNITKTRDVLPGNIQLATY